MNTDKDMVVTTPEELAEAVRAAPRVLAVGAGTKARLSAVAGDVVKISTVKLSGIVEYEPSEFTFTALAGTPVREIEKALAERGQYLPFDPLLVDAGATIGGTVAAGLGHTFRYLAEHPELQRRLRAPYRVAGTRWLLSLQPAASASPPGASCVPTTMSWPHAPACASR